MNGLTDVVHALVKDDRKGAQPPHGETLVVGQAGLLDVDVKVFHGIHHSHRLVHLPARVGVAHQRNGQVDLALRTQLQCLTRER